MKISTLLILIAFCCAKCKEIGKSDNKVTNLNGTVIKMDEQCKKRLCVMKCCPGEDTFIPFKSYQLICSNKTSNRTDKPIDIYSHIIPIYKNNGREMKISTKSLKNDFLLVNSKRFDSPMLFVDTPRKKLFYYYLTEDGTLKIEKANHFVQWIQAEKHDFCIDLVNTNGSWQVAYGWFLTQGVEQYDKSLQLKLTLVAMLISCFFLLMVLIVYGLLPRLRNIGGKILMAYVFSMFVSFLSQATTLTHNILGIGFKCHISGPIVYYTTLSIFFWLNIMSLDIWWTFRGNRKHRDIHRQGQTIKFLWYCLFAWGSPLVMVIGYVIMDNSELPAYIAKPFFKDCFNNPLDNIYFLYVPLGIMWGINLVLYVMTTYNICLISRELALFNSKENRKNKSRLMTYIKLSTVMGISWILEIVQLFFADNIYIFILLNAYNGLIGVIIFFLFIFNKKTFIALCIRLNIKSKFVSRMESKTTTNTSRGTTRTLSKNSATEMTEVMSDVPLK